MSESALSVVGLDLSLARPGACWISTANPGPALNDAFGIEFKERVKTASWTWPPGERQRAPQDLTERTRRLVYLVTALGDFCEQAAPDAICAEGIAYKMPGRNVDLGRLRGALELEMARRKLPPPQEVAAPKARKAVLGFCPRRKDGEPENAVKAKIAERLRLMGYTFPTHDEADAFVIAAWALGEIRLARRVA
jgi:Holliday junction resolvasome RuvABC endonuclease subunit